MKRKFKILTSFLICNMIIMTYCIPVHAEGVYTLQDYIGDWQDYISSGTANQDIQRDTLVILKKAFGSVGWLIDEGGMLWNKVKDAIHGSDSNIDSNSTDEEVKDWITDHTTVSGNGVTFDISMQNAINNYHDNYVSENPSFCYSYGLFDIQGNNLIPRNTGVFRSVAQYEKALDLIKGPMPINAINYDKNNLWFVVNPSSGYQMLYRFDLTQHPYLIIKPRDAGTFVDSFNPNFIDGYTNTTLSTADYAYKWNGTDWELQESSTFNNNTNRLMTLSKNPKRNTSDWQLCINYVSRGYRFYPRGTTIDAQNILTQPYYYNNTTWSNYQNSAGDYTVDNSNINTVTYGDTVSYINSFNNEEGYPPTIPEINNYITEQNEQNVTPDNGGSGGGGSGGDGSGGSGDGSSIWDFLSQLGTVLGGLISNLGSMLTSLIEGIVSVITDLLESIPDTMNLLIGAVFGWLPAELKALFALGISLMVLVGLVKLFKG